VALGWGIIGTGGFAGNATAPAINALGSEGSLVAVVSRDRGRADAFAKQHGARRAYTDYADLLRDPDVNIVYISTPNALHAEQAHPVHLARRFVDVLLAGVVEFGDAPKDARGEARPEIRRVTDPPFTRKRGAAGHLLDALRAQRGELVGEQRLQAARRRGKEIFHRLSVWSIDAGWRAARG